MAGPVVVVEDELTVLTLVCDILKSQGIEVLAIGHPALAASLEPDLNPRLFLIDLMLPSMSGEELAAQLRDRFPSCPMVAMSASSANMRSAMTSGRFQGHLRKPFGVRDLLAVLPAP
jgi:CheY-like chemotaxis protein